MDSGFSLINWDLGNLGVIFEVVRREILVYEIRKVK